MSNALQPGRLLSLSSRLLMGPGPSNVHPRVYQALSAPLVGHLDPQFLEIMDSLQEMLRRVFQTSNRATISVSGTGSAGMEAALVNVVEPGDKTLICVNGVFGTRALEGVLREVGFLDRIGSGVQAAVEEYDKPTP